MDTIKVNGKALEEQIAALIPAAETKTETEA